MMNSMIKIMDALDRSAAWGVNCELTGQQANVLFKALVNIRVLTAERDAARMEAAAARVTAENVNAQWEDLAQQAAALTAERDALAAQVTALETGLRDLLPGAQWTARFDPDLRATVARIDALLHDTTSADEREARREPPFAALPEVY